MNTGKGQKEFFTEKLMQWHASENERSLPWKGEKDPYKIWLSEIILQQTRAGQGEPYYRSFISAFPTVRDMALADDEMVYRLWQGLGYYNRCKNMLGTARFVSEELDGRFPDSYEKLLLLKGVGPYTAAAIASFAYGLPYAVVDGNVYRVLSRYFGIDTPIDSTAGKKLFSATAEDLLYTQDSAGYNQSIMDLGATICKPKKPVCGICPLQKNCIAYRRELIDLLPVKSKKAAIKKRFFYYVIIVVNDRVWLHKRGGNDIWENLYEPYLVEQSGPVQSETMAIHEHFRDIGIDAGKLVYEGASKQQLTHQLIEAHFYILHLAGRPKGLPEGGAWVAFDKLKGYAFPKTLVSFLEKKLYF